MFKLLNKSKSLFLRVEKLKTMKTYATLHPGESFLNGTNATTIEHFYKSWKQNPDSVENSWKKYFEQIENDDEFIPKFTRQVEKKLSEQTGGYTDKDVQDHIRLMLLIRNYRVRGHFSSDLDPLKLKEIRFEPTLQIEHYGFTEADLDRKFHITDIADISPSDNFGVATLREVIEHLKKSYTRHVGFEYYHIADSKQRAFLRNKIESTDFQKADEKTQKRIYKYMMKGEIFEQFLNTKFGSTKRFGCDGGEAMIPGMNEMCAIAAENGVETIVLGMPHRGRLNTLANIMMKPLDHLFHDFHPSWSKEDEGEGSGDVKYHLGASNNRTFNYFTDEKKLHLSMASNPSHLEAVNPIVVGKCRAKQLFQGDKERKKVMGFLVHGDAAFAGQGIVAETLGLSNLKFYQTGGTIHLIVNNQIGFTVDPSHARSSPYPSDVAKMVGAPIFHVNGDDPIAVANVFKLAVEWRQKFQKDVVIDMLCYRKYGHNELDEPSFTQPQMYKIIRNRESTGTYFEKKLVDGGVLTQEEATQIKDNIRNLYEVGFQSSKTFKPARKDWLEFNWSAFVTDKTIPTGISVSNLKEIGLKLSNLPKELSPHRGVGKIFKDRVKAIEEEDGLDWGTCEALAYGSLLLENCPVRIAGQDSERGTFSHRHAVVHDQKDFTYYIPHEHLSKDQAEFRVVNSNLTEFAALGFELGYSIEHPNILVLWEAQFGDFANGAQIIFDQFISCGEKKWYRQSGLTVLLPHGYDGNGPEHSSGRMERFLQMIDEHPYNIPEDAEKQHRQANFSVVNCTTPANFFHVLRRQIMRGYRKPLIVFTPKKLLKSRLCKSSLKDMDEGTSFTRLIGDEKSNVERLYFCSGQIYYDLEKVRNEKNYNYGIARLEEIAPFPFDLVIKELEKSPKAEIYWVQEEHMNMGPWNFVQQRLETCLESLGRNYRVKYIGRAPAAAPSTGIKEAHESQHREIMEQAFPTQ